MKGRPMVQRSNTAPKTLQSVLKSAQFPSTRSLLKSSFSRSLSNKDQQIPDDFRKNSFNLKGYEGKTQAESISKSQSSQRHIIFDKDGSDSSLLVELDPEEFVRELKHISFDKTDPLPINIM